MSNKIPLIMDNVLNTCWAILPAKLSEIMAVLQAKNNDFILEMTEQGKQSKAQDSNYTVDDGIAMITINGTLSKRMGLIQAISGGTSYSNIQSQVKRAEDDPAVKGIFLDIDSPGGAVSEMFNTADAIFGLRGTKPSLAFANGLMASAAYIIGSGADCVVASDRSAETGSLGVISVLFDESKKYEKEGIKPTVFAAGQYKKIGNKFEPLSKPDKKYIQSKLDYMFTLATDTVSRHRNISASDLIANDIVGGDVFIGEQGINAGLVDQILTREKALEKLKDVIDGRASFRRNNKIAVRSERIRTTKKFESERRTNNMQTIKSFDLKSIAEQIQSCKSLDDLKSLEDQCLLHFSEAEKTASNWIKEAEAKTTGRKVAELTDLRRRQLLALPQIQKDAEEYALGKIIGKK